MIDKKRANEPIEFIQMLHLTDDFYGQPFALQNWQRDILWDVYGTVKSNGLRQYKFVYLEIPKKNGKTTLIAGIGIYHIVCDGPGGQIFCCAADRKQAELVYNAAVNMISQDEDLAELLKIKDSTKEITNRETGTVLRVLSAEAFTKHGINPTVVIFDELHAQPNRDLWDVMTFGSGSARREPLYWIITTAGDDPDHKSIGWEIHEKARKIRDGESSIANWYVRIYGAPDDANIYDEDLWYAVNPSLGISIDIEVLREEATEAAESPSAEKLFRWLRLNQWVSLKRVGWLPITLWDQTQGGWLRPELFGKRCYVGIDLSSKIDLTAIAVLFPPQNGVPDWRFILYSWVPEDNMKERQLKDHVPYIDWVRDGYLEATPGNVVDYGFIRNQIEKIELQFNVQYYCGDQWHLEILRQLLSDEVQRKLIEVPQTMGGMTQGMGELERLFRSEQISHEHTPLGRWAFGNVVVAIDGNENMKPMKDRSIERIDPIVALIDAMAGAIRLEPKQSVYEQRGIRVI